MSPTDIQRLLKRVPFKPFTLVMSNDERFDVFHPEMLIVGRSILALGVTPPGNNDTLADYIVWLAPEHVLKIEPQEPAKAT